MKQHRTASSEQSSSTGFSRLACAVLALFMLAACEAPLNLSGVENERNKVVARYDLFQSIAHVGERVAVVSSTGAFIFSQDNGASWQRQSLEGRPSLIDVTACDNGQFYALDSEKRVWLLSDSDTSTAWPPIDTYGRTLSIHCAPGNQLWVSASEALLYRRDLDSDQWQEFALEEQLAAAADTTADNANADPYADEFEDDYMPPPQFTDIHFFDSKNGFVIGEFGTLIASKDGGDTWDLRTPVPNDFYPMASAFLDTKNLWVGGLDGVIWMTSDGGTNWQRQETGTSAPIYGIYAGAPGVFAVGGGAKLVEYRNSAWQPVANSPAVLAFFRGLDVLTDGTLLIAGSGGALERVSIQQAAEEAAAVRDGEQG